jgi:glutamate synthase domain-containing protein 1
MLNGLPPIPREKAAEEGGCGVVGFAASVPVRGRHIFEPSMQMHNRGNGKGGGIAAAGMIPEQLGVDEHTLNNDYLLQIALLDPKAGPEVEKRFIAPYFKIDHKAEISPKTDYREVGLQTKPPDIARYFVRVKHDVLSTFAKENGLDGAEGRTIEDEFLYRNTFKLNQSFYASLGEKRAFVLSHARNLMILKIVGYAEQVVQYYGMEDFKAQVWIAHQRYPTKGRVWHPGGAHPFIGLNEALVHNGDFANYFSVSEYLKQHNIAPQFLTDTEVAALLFDLLNRVYDYPLEYVIEALAPTTELDFDRLPLEKQRIYRAIQAVHIHGSPDGPWFFIIARSNPDQNVLQLLGITDTSMLRPQVFALQQNGVSIGLVASEKQAIDATLRSLSEDDKRFRPVADKYWNARGGSHTDGGAFLFTVSRQNGSSKLVCTDKFGKPILVPGGEIINCDEKLAPPEESADIWKILSPSTSDSSALSAFERISGAAAGWGVNNFRWAVEQIEELGKKDDNSREWALEVLTLLNDRHYDCGKIKRSATLEAVHKAINAVLDAVDPISSNSTSSLKRIDWRSRSKFRAPWVDEKTLVIFAKDFPPEGDDCDARLLVEAYRLGWKNFIVYGLKGQRFTGDGLGMDTDGVRIDLYGSSGDYLASGIDGLEIRVHGNAQDQLGQIMKRGKLVIHGDVGQTFMYGAKGGEVYILGNAAGRPLINAVGRPRVVINGTSLDFLAESFMAGDPNNGGGFIILNGVEFDDHGRVREQESPYPGSNLFSLASGGAIFVRDPHKKLVDEQLNGGEYAGLTDADWKLILPYLETNEKLFGISIERDLLTVGGVLRQPKEVYRKVRPVKRDVLAKIQDSE